MTGVRAATAVFLLLAWAAAAAAGDPWREKRPEEWTAKEVQRILEDSPWARPITVQAVWRRPGEQGQEVSSTAQAGKLPERRRDEEQGPFPPRGEEMARFTLRWASARTVRRAVERAGQLGVTAAAEASRAGPDEYELLLAGDLLVPFPDVRAGELAENTYLTVRSSGEKQYPVRVVLHRSQGRIRSLSFFFRRFTAQGRQWLGRDERSLEFICRAGPATFRARFEPPKMLAQDGPDW